MTEKIRKILSERILVLDGAMGTMVQACGLTEVDFRGKRFSDSRYNLKGHYDLLSLTKPQTIREIHEAYLSAGADIIETDTLNANAISLSDFGMGHLSYEMNKTAATIAREAADKFTAETPEKPRFVAGSIGPTNKMASMSADVDDPGARSVDFDELVRAYRTQIRGLRDGGADILLIETIFDGLNAKAALFAIEEEEKESGVKLPVMVSVTISDAGGRTLSGQTLKSFMASVSHVDLLSFGLNCGFGAPQMRPFLEDIAESSPFYVSLYPNAGLPNQFGEYDETPEAMAATMEEYIKNGWINIAGGCCGTSPAHIAAISAIVSKYKPRKLPTRKHKTIVCGLETLVIDPKINFVNIGERTNVSGSRKFARLMREENYGEALSIARNQIENGAQVIDICMDDSMLDAKESMKRFLNLLESEPEIATVPFMIDSSNWEVIEAGLKCIQGRPVVNSVSLKEGEGEFLRKARLVHEYGAVMVVMLFDENGQADTYERKISVARRSYDLLVNDGFPPEDIIFDPNVLAIATGISDHDAYAVNFIDCCRWIKKNLPYAKISGGISNLSFSFRGNDIVREALHSVFLYHAVKAGLDMGIVNAGQLTPYDQIDSKLRQLAEDVVLNRRQEATEELLAYAEKIRDKAGNNEETETPADEWRKLSVGGRLEYAMVRGITDYLEKDIAEGLDAYEKAIDIIEQPLMKGMNRVGDLFGAGKMFLPQVVKSARVMKTAVSLIEPAIIEQKDKIAEKPVKILLATVKGDVHDIGKNIVSVVLSCNGFDIVDLGVMVPCEKIVDEAISCNADAIGLSGLITPSLEEMKKVCIELARRKANIPVMIGGATTSELHTAIKLDPEYPGMVYYVKDASRAASVLKNITDASLFEGFRNETAEKYNRLREAHERAGKKSGYLGIKEARKNAPLIDWKTEKIDEPSMKGIKQWNDFSLEEIIPYIDWTYFFNTWGFKGVFPDLLDDPEKGMEARKLFDDAKSELDELCNNKKIRAKAVIGIFPANSSGDDILVSKDGKEIRFCQLRDQRKHKDGEPNYCLSDFLAPVESGIKDYIGGFVVSVGQEPANLSKKSRELGDDYTALLIETLCDRMVEAFSEVLFYNTRKNYWGYAPDEVNKPKEILSGKYRGIRPAIGYPVCPDHSLKRKLFKLTEATERIGTTYTESYMMQPVSSVCGFMMASPHARYFDIAHITKDQAEDYFKRSDLVFEPLKQLVL